MTDDQDTTELHDWQRPEEGREPFDHGRLDSLGPAIPAPRIIDVVSAASLAGREVPQRSWIVPDLLPDRQVAILSGDGGVGKSLLALQLAAAIATGGDWIGTLPIGGPVLYLGAEDELDEMHRRLTDIASSRGTGLSTFVDLHLLSLAGEDAVLAVPDSAGLIAMTPLWRAVEEKVEVIRPRLLVVDNSADVFAGNEISRAQVRQFVAALRGLALRLDLAVLLLSHPSLTGINSGSGASGSTAWSNSVRSRLYLDRPKAEDGAAPDPDLRVLRVMKANYAATGAETRLRWKAGVLRPDGVGLSGFDRAAGEADAETAFLHILARFHEQGRNVSHQPGPTYAPAQFARSPDAAGISRRGFVAAMERLFTAGRIRVEEYGRLSKRRSRIASV